MTKERSVMGSALDVFYFLPYTLLWLSGLGNNVPFKKGSIYVSTNRNAIFCILSTGNSTFIRTYIISCISEHMCFIIIRNVN